MSVYLILTCYPGGRVLKSLQIRCRLERKKDSSDIFGNVRGYNCDGRGVNINSPHRAMSRTHRVVIVVVIE